MEPLGFTLQTPLDTVSPVHRCPECGFDHDLARAIEAPASIVEGSMEFVELLREHGAEVRTRHSPEVWSPLEYACHLRDVFLVQRERVLLARRRDRPTMEPMGRDERVDHDGYADQEPPEVGRQLMDAALMLANVLTRLDDDDWERMVVFDNRTPPERSLRWLALHTLHEVRHHLADARVQLA